MSAHIQSLPDLLVLVHPGSCYGSAGDQIGRQEARGYRDMMARDLNLWTGAVAIVDGLLSDEIGEDDLGLAIQAAVGRGAVRIDACDADGGLETAGEQLEGILGTMAGRKVSLTGAWATEDDSSGCVNEVARQLRERGAETHILDSAIFDPHCGLDDEEDEDFSENARGTFSP